MRHLPAWALALALAGAQGAPAATPAPQASGSMQIRAPGSVAVFDEVWQTVRDRFYDPSLRGLDWASVRARYAPQAAAARSEQALAAVINAMLAELHASHTELYTPVEPMLSFQNKVGRPVILSIRRHADGAVEPMRVTPAELQPHGMFLEGLKASARLIPTPNGLRIGYVHVWSYAGKAYQEALEQLLGEGLLKDADALVLDLREGWGGAVPEYLDLFNARAPPLQVRGRDGRTELDNVKWRRPVAMLVNERSRSGKEVLAYGFEKYRLGEVIGSRTSGAVLAATAFMMRDGDLLLLAVDDVRVDGERLEGTGVDPTIMVPFDSRYAAGRDPQLDRAIAVLSHS